MAERLIVKGFKCYRSATFPLNRITVLSGCNAAGKSTVIQSLLLLREAIVHSKDNRSNVRLFGHDGMDLGTVNDVFNNELADGLMELQLDGTTFRATLDANPEDKDTLLMEAVNHDAAVEGVLREHFAYLSAERQGPRYSSELLGAYEKGCGASGEQTARVIAEKDMANGDVSKNLRDTNSVKFSIQRNEWAGYLFPGIAVSSEYIGKRTLQIRMNNSNYANQTTANNIGFGISYALPIIVEGLLAPAGSLLVVENPEAHLHPKAQSNMGYFLGKMAGAGVQILIETHSEHVINGIRRAALSTELTPSGVTIYFFEGKKTEGDVSFRPITLNRFGAMSDFPEDFFDQARQDLLELNRLSRNIQEDGARNT